MELITNQKIRDEIMHLLGMLEANYIMAKYENMLAEDILYRYIAILKQIFPDFDYDYTR